VRKRSRFVGEWTNHQERELLAMRADGMGDAEIGKVLHRSESAITQRRFRILRRSACNPGWRLYSDAEKVQLVHLWNSGVSAKEIGIRLCRTQKAVFAKARALGLPRRRGLCVPA
jgi:hypothetical protein